jgi:von Willebrand factor type A domain
VGSRILVLLCLLLGVDAAAENRAVVFVIDRGMTKAKIETVRKAFKEIAFNEGDRVGVVAVGDTAQVIQSISGGPSRARIVPTTAPTNLVVGLEAAREMATRVRGTRRLVVVITDRDHGAGFEDAVERLVADGIRLVAISHEGTNQATVKALARFGRGRHYTTVTSIMLRDTLQREVDEAPRQPVHVFVIDRTLPGAQLLRARDALVQRLDSIAEDELVGVVTMDSRPRVLARLQPKRRMVGAVLGLTTSANPADRDYAFTLACDLLADGDVFDQPLELAAVNGVTKTLPCDELLRAIARTTGAAPRTLP